MNARARQLHDATSLSLSEKLSCKLWLYIEIELRFPDIYPICDSTIIHLLLIIDRYRYAVSEFLKFVIYYCRRISILKLSDGSRGDVTSMEESVNVIN